VDDLKTLERKTARKDRHTTITWDQTFKFPLTTVTPSKLHLELIESDDTILGKESIKLTFIIKNEGRVTEKTYHLEPSGEISLKLSWETESVSKKDKRRSTELTNNNMIEKKADRKAKAKSTLISQALVSKEVEKEKEKPKKNFRRPASPKVLNSSSDFIDAPVKAKFLTSNDALRVYPPAPRINVPSINPDEILPELWNSERKCLLMLLETRVLFREILEYRFDFLKKPKLTGSVVELRKLLAIYPDDEEDDSDLIAQIAN